MVQSPSIFPLDSNKHHTFLQTLKAISLKGIKATLVELLEAYNIYR